MALNGSVSVEATPNGRDVLVFSWEAVQDSAALTSTVSWKFELVADEYGALHVTDAEIYPWAVTVDGQAFSGNSNIFIGANETVTLASGEAVLAHEANGTKVFEFTFMQDFAGLTWGNGTVINEVTGTGTGELDALTKKFPIREFVNGLIMALCCSPIAPPQREPVAYLYGHVAKEGETPTHTINGVGYVGVVAPDIYSMYTPELQETHPYALIIHYQFDNGSSLSCLQVFSKPFTTIDLTDEYGYVSVQVLEDGGTYMEWVYRSDENTDWMGANIPITSDTWETRTTKIWWANTTIYNPDGSVYLAATDPIPVYE